MLKATWVESRLGVLDDLEVQSEIIRVARGFGPERFAYDAAHHARDRAAHPLLREGLMLGAPFLGGWLGHHSPAFTLSTYVHLLDGDLVVRPFSSGAFGGVL